jgi:aldehyde dehydrogenase (NAD+)
MELAKLMDETDLPPGVVNVVTGRGSEIGRALSSNPQVDKIALTGSTETGREIMGHASSQIKKITLELGGKSPTIVLKDADLEAAHTGSNLSQSGSDVRGRISIAGCKGDS